jgi:membrane-associated protease RseP (regulator of RpoE activity)
MNRTIRLAWLLSAAALGSWFGGDGTVRADEPARVEGKRQVIVIEGPEVTAYWLGVSAESADDLLKKHLNIDSGLVVASAVPDGPAAKVGVEQHDVLVKFNDVELKQLEDLTKAVAENKDKEATVELIRGGKPLTIKITPAKRPAGVAAFGIGPDSNSPLRLWSVRPGFRVPWMEKNLDLPQGTSITIAKEGDGPTKITVKQGDKRWEVTEDKLGDLPDDVRPMVERLLGGGFRAELELPATDADEWMKRFRDGWPKFVPDLPLVQVYKGHAPSGIEKQLDDMRRELKELREAVNELRGRDGSKPQK